VVEFAAAEGLDYMFDPGIRVREDGCEDAVRYRLSDRQYAMLLRDRRLFVRPPAARRGAVERQRPCGVGRGVVSVAPNGDVWPCPRIADPVGNLARDALESVWLANPLLARYAGIRWGDLPACRACEWVRWCDRCHADALQEDGDLLGPSRFACRRARIRAALARRCATGVARGGGSHRLSTVAGAAGAAGGLSASKGG
jgi:radical SAM protein with 4Fe4S-binding SPASM domain